MKPSDKRSIAPWAIVLLLAVAAVLTGLFWPSEAVHAEDGEMEAGTSVVAVVGDAEITRGELEEALASELRDLDRQRQQLLEEGLQRVVAERLIEIEAEAAGLSSEEYLQRDVAGKVPEPSEDEVDAFYEARKDQMGQPKEELAPRIREFLKQQAGQVAYAALLADLRSKHGVETLLEPMRLEVASAGSPGRGPEDAPVTIVEFSDFQCPFCSKVVPTLDQVAESYGDKVRIVFRQFPLDQLHPDARKAAEASLCAHEQDSFWAMHDTLFREQKALGVEQLKQKAARLELDTEAFNGCLDSGRYAEQVQTDVDEGREAGVSGTPAFFINGRFLSGAQPYDKIAQIIDDELSRSGG